MGCAGVPERTDGLLCKYVLQMLEVVLNARREPMMPLLRTNLSFGQAPTAAAPRSTRPCWPWKRSQASRHSKSAGTTNPDKPQTLIRSECAQALEVGLDAPRVLMLELAERVAADTLLRATPGAPKGCGPPQHNQSQCRPVAPWREQSSRRGSRVTCAAQADREVCPSLLREQLV